MPKIDAPKYQVGYGITVEIEGETVRVGSRRFMEMEGIAIPAIVQRELDQMHAGRAFLRERRRRRSTGRRA